MDDAKPDTQYCPSGELHKMEMIGDLVFACATCGHTEIGCSHGRKAVKNGYIFCEICTQNLGTAY